MGSFDGTEKYVHPKVLDNGDPQRFRYKSHVDKSVTSNHHAWNPDLTPRSEERDTLNSHHTDSFSKSEVVK